MNEQEEVRKLYDLGYNPMPRLIELREQSALEPVLNDEGNYVDPPEAPTDAEILALWHVCRESMSYTGYSVTIRDFGAFLKGGQDDFNPINGQLHASYKSAEVTW
jgi:hypothetical protein